MKKTLASQRESATADGPAPAGDEAGRGGSLTTVGVGASAGGLEAFTELLKHLPLDTGMAFVLIQHLDPQHESALAQLLSRATSLSVCEVKDNRRVEANHVYVIPANAALSISQGVLKLQPRRRTGTPNRSIDFFLQSLAQDQRERAIGVILSGTATDGTLGLQAIKAEGGITFAQDESARHASMPRSAVAAGCVDFILSPEKIASELARIARHPFVAGPPSELLKQPDELPPRAESVRGGEDTVAQWREASYKKILLLLRNHSGVDFSLYKSTTIRRRISRRMVLTRQETLEDYAVFMGGNTKELDALYCDALIHVTSFFRNPEAFDTLKRKVFAKLLAEPSEEPLRAWVLGCSTGQEAYSIAMAFVESAEKVSRARTLQVFATDLHGMLLDKARHGLYSKSVEEDISPGRLRRFFTEEEGGYRVSKLLREMVVFARHNLAADPPFSRMDLVSCRNVLIYLEPSLQKRVLPTFHYALKREGFLFLGASESIGGFTELFEPADGKHRIYSKKAAPMSALHLHLPVKRDRGDERAADERRPFPVPMRIGEPDAPEGLRGELDAQREADRFTIKQFAPPGVLINAELQILQFRGPTGAYLQPPSGKASFDVLKMAREGLMLPLRAAINKAKKENKAARQENVRVRRNGKTRKVHLEVIPLKNARERCFLIVFEKAGKARRPRSGGPERKESEGAARSGRAGEQAGSGRIAELEKELAETRDYLESMQEQHEAANEELQAANEEVESANEELQSVNEELETSKEELESANEELTTVNEEMAHRNIELNRLNSDLVNLQTSTKLAVLLLGRDLLIRRFSAQAEKQFELLATDVGRPISAVRHSLDLGSLEALVREVIDTAREQERDVRAEDGRWYLLRVRPYVTVDNKVDGAVLVLVDIDAMKRSEEAIAEARDYAQNTVETVREPLLVLDSELRVESANRSFYRTFHVAPAATVGKSIFELGHGQWDIPWLRTLLEELLPQRNQLDDFLVEQDVEHLGRRTMLFNARRLADPQRRTERILLAIEDVTQRQQHQQELQRARDYAQAIIRTVPDPLVILDGELCIERANEAFYKKFGGSSAEAEGHAFFELGNRQWDVPKLRELLEAIVPRHSFFNNFEITGDFVHFGRRTLLMSARGIRDAAEGQPPRILLGIQDVTEMLQFQAETRRSEIRYRRLFEAARDGVLIIDPATRKILDANPFMTEMLGYTRKELLGKELFEIGLLRDEAASRAAFRELREKGFIRYEDLPLEGEAGERREVEFVSNLYEEDGEKVIQCNIRDITERKQAEAALRESEGRFRQLVEALGEADRHKTEFVAMLAHELRNPLAPIRNALQVMRLSESSGEHLQAACEMMERQVGHMVRLVDDLLDVSRVSRGKIELRRGLVELTSVVRHAVEAARPLADSLNHELTVTLPPQPVHLDADPTRLAQIIGNLLSNACKFTDAGGRIWLTVEVVARSAWPAAGENQGEDDDGKAAENEAGRAVLDAVAASADGGRTAGLGTPHAVIRVRDSGIGIGADQLPNVFKMFMQIDTSVERKQSGLGIGLTLVKNLVEMHGGTIEVRSAGAGEGSEFVVRLPILDETSEPPAEPIVSRPTVSPSTGRRPTAGVPAAMRALSILVVDDNRDSAESLAMLLKLGGHKTHTAYDGLEAVEAAEQVRPDVVLLDIGLPKLNGYEAARRIREQSWGQQMVMVALTGWGQDEDRQKSRDAGFDGHLVKPVHHADLARLLAEVMPR